MDANWASSVDDGKSTNGYCVYYEENLVSWSSKKQNAVARSSTESEYTALANGAAKIAWIHESLKEIGAQQHHLSNTLV